jgi:hypothetical protein
MKWVCCRCQKDYAEKPTVVCLCGSGSFVALEKVQDDPELFKMYKHFIQ